MKEDIAVAIYILLTTLINGCQPNLYSIYAYN